MDPNYQYTDEDILAVLRKKDSQIAIDYAVVKDSELTENFFALDLLKHIRDVEGEIENRRFAVAIHVSNSHWVTMAIESTGVDKEKAKKLYVKLKEKDGVNHEANEEQVIFPDSEALQDQEIATLVKEVYANTKVQFIDSTERTYLNDERKANLNIALSKAFGSVELKQVTGITQQELSKVHCGPLTCLNVESFLATGKIAEIPEEKSYETYITEVRQQHFDRCGPNFQARQNAESNLSTIKWASESFARLGSLKIQAAAIENVVKNEKVKAEIKDFLKISQDKLQPENTDYKLAFELQLQEIESVLKPPRP